MTANQGRESGRSTSDRASALDPLAMLATGVHAQPGVYALLLGSGVSTGAGIPTGWGVVRELIRTLAAATDPDNAAAADQAAEDPEQWWATHGDGAPLGYSNLLAAVAPTPAARRALLTRFFEPAADDAEAGRKVPGPAHRVIAELVKRRLVRVILTTNFDRLVERALEDAGVPPQVASRPDTVAGLTPLVHAPVTVIKLHGDYADLDMRNTVDELQTYPPEWDALLARVFDEYGLLVSGWSADWDKALVTALKRSPSRRWPLYWDSRSSRGEAATQLLAQHRGITVTAPSADELFTGLLTRVEALERLAAPPLTTAMAVTQLKRYLPDPTRRIDLHDLVSQAVTAATDAATEEPVYQPDLDGAGLQEVFGRLLAHTDLALRLLTTGVFHDRNREHCNLWVASLQQLMRARARFPDSRFQGPLDYARHYPALLALRAMGVIAVDTGRDDVLMRLFTRPTWRDIFDTRERLPAWRALQEQRIAASETVNAMPQWVGQQWQFPSSHLLRADLREVLRPIISDDDDYKWASDRFEYRQALLQHSEPTPYAHHWASLGVFIQDSHWLQDGRLQTEVEFRSCADRADDDWPWWPIVGGPDGLDDTLGSLRNTLARMRGYV